jgi:hypothetical protein
MRQLIEERVISALHQHNPQIYHWLQWTSDSARAEVISHCEASVRRLSDLMLMKLYDQLRDGKDIVVCSTDDDGQFCNVKVNGIYGGMIADGSIHT